MVGLVQGIAPQVLRTVEEISGDVAWRWSVSSVPERRVVVVDIDEASLDKHGAWPWPRATLVSLSQRLQEAGVAVQAIDLALDANRPGDDQLQEVWRHSPVVLGQIFSLDPQTAPQVGTVVGAVAARPGGAGTSCPPFAPVSWGYRQRGHSGFAQLGGGAPDAPGLRRRCRS